MSFTLYDEIKTEDYLKAAIEAAKYIEKFEVKENGGIHWSVGATVDREIDDVEKAFLNVRNLYAGASGIGYFFVQLYDATGDDKWLEKAKGAADYLISTYTKEISQNPGVHSGAAGEGLLLELLFDKTGDEKYRKHSLIIADDIYESAVHDEEGIHWHGIYDFMGDGGAIIFWLDLAKKTGEEKFINYSKEVIEALLSKGEKFGDNGTLYRLFDPSIFFTVLPKGGVVPNFAHGTGGIIYLLTKLYEATKDEKYLDAAKSGFNFLKEIAIKDETSAIVPYLYFENEDVDLDVYYLGYCHGPAGDGIAIYELYRATGDEEYLDFYKKLVNSLVKADVFNKKSSGYWNDCLCCGSASVLQQFLLSANVIPENIDFAKRVADKSVNDAYKDKDGYRWYNAWTRVKPWDVEAHHGLYVGAAGSASALLSLYGKLEGKEITPLFEYK